MTENKVSEATGGVTYLPSLDSVRSHPVPDWFHDAKLGIFIHWGPYSIPAFAPHGTYDIGQLMAGKVGFEQVPYAEWYQNSLRVPGSPTEQYHRKTYGADFTYEQFGVQLDEQVRAWQPDAWADLFARAGARYVVLVTKHHDGFLMWNSRHPNPRTPAWQLTRDVAGELTAAVSARDMKMGFYYSSLLDWSFTPAPARSLADVLVNCDPSRAYLDYVEAHWRELIERYDPAILWSDIGYPPGFKLPQLFADFYNHNPEGVVNDRWMQMPGFLFGRVGRTVLSQVMKRLGQRLMNRMMQGETTVPHCDFITPEYSTLANVPKRKWEACRGIGSSFGYNQFETATDYLTADDLVRLLADIVSKNGNLLLNVGPRGDGSISPEQLAALEGLGAWLKANGEAIYGTRPWERFQDAEAGGAEVRYTSKGDVVYAIVTRLPPDRRLSLPVPTATVARLVETGQELPAEHLGEKLIVALPDSLPETSIPVIAVR